MRVRYKMTRKDYELLTNVLKGRRENTWELDKLGWTGNEITVGISIIDDLTDFLASELWNDNKSFDRAKFVNDIRGL